MDDGMEIVNIKSVVCVYCGLAIGHDIAPTEAGVAAIRDLMCKHDAVCESNPLVAHIATLEARETYWYEADGTVTCHAPEVVKARRIAAAKRLATLERDLAAAQAEVVEARAALGKCACLPECSGGYSDDGSVFPCVRCNLLSCPPGSLSALEAMLTKAATAAIGYDDNHRLRGAEVDNRAAAIVSRILGKEAAR